MVWPATRALRFGDIVSLDVGVIYNGFIGDTARTVAVGGCDVLAQKLMDVTEKALYEGIAQALPAAGWLIFRGPSRIMWKATGSASSGSSSGTGWAARCTKSRRCRTSWTASLRPGCGRG